jgi:hypothetical protein
MPRVRIGESAERQQPWVPSRGPPGRAAGHMVNRERPEIVSDLLIDFLTRPSPG